MVQFLQQCEECERVRTSFQPNKTNLPNWYCYISQEVSSFEECEDMVIEDRFSVQ